MTPFLIAMLLSVAQPQDAKKEGEAPARAGGPPPANVVVDPIRMERLERRREVTGELRSMRRSVVAAEVGGQVMMIDILPGERVKAGQVIARLDATLAQLESDRADATVAVRRAILAERESTLALAERDVSRLEAAALMRGATELELDRRRTEAAEARARTQSAKAELAYSEADLLRVRKRVADMNIHAPFDGVVISKRSEVGQWVSEGDPVAEIVDLNMVEAWIDVSELVADRFALAMAGGGEAPQVLIRFPGLSTPQEEFVRTGSVIAVVPEADTLSRLFPVRVQLDNSDGRLRPGTRALGVVPTGEPDDFLTVHRDAILRDSSGPYLYFDMGGKAMIARVEVLFAAPAAPGEAPSSTRVAIRAPSLSPGLNAVVEGNERLFPTQPLMSRPRTPAPAAGAGSGEAAAGAARSGSGGGSVR